jgi:hypothetical protein
MPGKSIDELNLSDTPLTAPEPEDARESEWYRFLQLIEDVIDRRPWAEDTLRGIQETVRQTHRVTDGQRGAVDNINHAEARRQRGSSRRYEGYGGWRR